MKCKIKKVRYRICFSISVYIFPTFFFFFVRFSFVVRGGKINPIFWVCLSKTINKATDFHHIKIEFLSIIFFGKYFRKIFIKFMAKLVGSSYMLLCNECRQVIAIGMNANKMDIKRKCCIVLGVAEK